MKNARAAGEFIAITGPESTGKTTLARFLSGRFSATLAPEYSRAYLNALGRPYRFGDIGKIAVGQRRNVENALRISPHVISDTYMLELRVWARRRFDRRCETAEGILEAHPPMAWLLCYPDLEWEPDPLRENPHDRHSLFEDYFAHVRASGLPHLIVEGEGEERHCAPEAFVSGLLEK